MKTRKLSIRRSTLRLLSGAEHANVHGGVTATCTILCSNDTNCPTDCDPIGCISELGTCAGQHTCKCRGTTGEVTPATEAECVSQETQCQSQPC